MITNLSDTERSMAIHNATRHFSVARARRTLILVTLKKIKLLELLHLLHLDL